MSIIINMNYGFKLGTSCLISALLGFLILTGIAIATDAHLRPRILTVLIIVGIIGYILLITSLTINRIRMHKDKKYMIVLWVLFEFVMLYLMIVIVSPLVALMPYETVVEGGLKIDYFVEGVEAITYPQYNLFFYK